MIFLKEITDDLESYKLLYSFVTSNNKNWKKTHILSIMMQGRIPPKQQELSDFLYFKLLRKIQKENEFSNSREYLLIVNGQVVTSIYVIMKNKNIADISFMTLEKYRQRGYATKALELIEEVLFKNEDILFTTITDMTRNKISSKIALKMGYVYSTDANCFIKMNPNKNLDDMKKR